MEEDFDVLLVAREDDRVAIQLQRELNRKGKRASMLNGPSAARLFTIFVGSPNVSVSPSIPLFVRASAWWLGDVQSRDQQFLRVEAYSTLWAAAALSSCPVVNRPGKSGTVLRLTAGALNLKVSFDGRIEGASETYASDPSLIQDDRLGMWGEDFEFRTGPINQFLNAGPIRARHLNSSSEYEIVTIVGNLAFPATCDERTSALRLAEHSLSLAKRFGVLFGTVSWSIDEGGATAVRLNTAPQEDELRYAFPEVIEALCKELIAC